jgi:hypothetical protein
MAYPRKKSRLTDLVTPLKPLEAMAQGKLVAASDVGGHRELMTDGVTGTLFPPIAARMWRGSGASAVRQNTVGRPARGRSHPCCGQSRLAPQWCALSWRLPRIDKFACT